MRRTSEQQKNENENSPKISSSSLPASTIQPVVTASGVTAGGDVNVISHVNINASPPSTTEQKREEVHQQIAFQLQQWKKSRLENEVIHADLATYIPVQGGKSFEDTQLFDVAEQVNAFLRSDKKVLLLLGDAGMGKSLFLQTLERALWQAYDANHPIPLFISLSNIEDPICHVLENHFTQMGFKPAQITLLKQHYSFIVILDGYDEIPNHHPDNLYVSNQLSTWKCQVIISCRSQYLLMKKDVYRNRFSPDYKGQPEPGLYEEIVLKPFTPAQRDSYLQKFVEVEKPIWSDWKRYQKCIETIPDLKQLIETPFILRTTVEVLPDVVKRYENNNATQNIGLTRADLYDAFTQRWFERQKYKLRQQKLLTDTKWDIKEDFKEFSKQLAMKLFQKGISEVVLETKVKSRFGKNPPSANVAFEWDEFFGNEGNVPLIRSGCPLKKVGENGYAFIHKSVQEYFGARQAFDHVAALKSAPSTSTQLAGLDLNQKHLNEELSIILFLVDSVKSDEKIKQLLLDIVMQSKKDGKITIAAANAMTILNVARVSFTGMDFSYANLSHVNLTQAWLRDANLFQAQIQGLQFGMRPYVRA